MARITYTGTHPDGSTFGGLFDSDDAEWFEGNDSDPDDYTMQEELYLTSDDRWILNRVVASDIDRSTYELITPERAREWLEENNYPEAVRRYFERPKGGRPRIGERLITRAPARMHNKIAVLAEMYGEDMPDTVRRLLDEALTHRETIGAPGSKGYPGGHRP